MAWRLHNWHTLFPRAQLWASRRAPLSLGQTHLPLTGVLGDAPHPDGQMTSIRSHSRGTLSPKKSSSFIDRRARLSSTNFIQHWPIAPGKPLRNLLSRLEGVAEAPGGVGLEIKLTFIDRTLARRSLAKLLSWDFDKLIIADGDCIDAHARPFIEEAFSWLMP